MLKTLACRGLRVGSSKHTQLLNGEDSRTSVDNVTVHQQAGGTCGKH